MRLSRRSEYGLRALVDLVRHADDGPIALATLAERNRLPAKFLEQIMIASWRSGVGRDPTIASATLGPTPLTVSSRVKKPSSSVERNPYSAC